MDQNYRDVLVWYSRNHERVIPCIGLTPWVKVEMTAPDQFNRIIPDIHNFHSHS